MTFEQRAALVAKIPLKDFISRLYKAPKELRRELIRLRGYYDFEFFCTFFFSEVGHDGKRTGHTKNSYNQFHKDYFASFVPDEKGRRRLIMAARGAAKTTFICLLDTLHRVCYGTEKYILILSSTTPLARQKAEDVYQEAMQNEKLQWAFNLRFAEKRKNKERFVLLSDYGQCIVHSLGFFGQIRGTKWGAHRPTRILLDDVTHGEAVFSEAQRDKAARQLKTDILQTKEPETSIIIICTVIHAQDPIVLLRENPVWESSTYKAIISWPENMQLWGAWEQIWQDPTLDRKARAAKAEKFYLDNKAAMDKGAKVLWPDRESLYYLMLERLDIGPRAFGAEKQMDPYLVGEALFEVIHWFEQVDQDGMRYIKVGEKYIEFNQRRFQMYYSLDPATSAKVLRKPITSKKKLSLSARIVAAYDTFTGMTYIIYAKMDRSSPSKLLSEMYDLHEQYRFTRMGVEENLFRETFGEYINAERKLRSSSSVFNEPLPIWSVWSDKPKELRIYGIEPAVHSGLLRFSSHLPINCRTQLQDYPNTDQNDFLDACELMRSITNPKSRARRIDWATLGQ